MDRSNESNKLNVIIPMAGLGSRFASYGFSENKYLLPIDKNLTKMIEKAILTLNVREQTCFIFIIKEENGPDIKLRNYLQELCIENNYICQILSVDKLTEGPASSVYIAKNLINNDTELIVSNSDQILDWNFEKFYKSCNNYDGCVLTYKPNYELVIGKTDKHSFVRYENNSPVEFIEKKVISDEALVGVHYYKKGKYFVDAYEYLVKNNIRAPNNEFYLSYTYQALLNIGGFKIGSCLLTNDECFYPVGEPQDYFNYYNKNSKFILEKLDNFNFKDEYKSYFKLEKIKKDTSENFNNELVIYINKNIEKNIILTGENKMLNFNEDAFILRIFNINSTFSNININDYTRGWLIGNFSPSIKNEINYEVGILNHKKMEKWPYHYHKESIEINFLIEGKMLINNIELNEFDVFTFEKNIIACPIFLQDCKILCIKIPSKPNDKWII